MKTERELSDGEVVSDNEGKSNAILSGGSSNALANLMGYASETEEEIPGISTTVVKYLYFDTNCFMFIHQTPKRQNLSKKKLQKLPKRSTKNVHLNGGKKEKHRESLLELKFLKK